MPPLRLLRRSQLSNVIFEETTSLRIFVSCSSLLTRLERFVGTSTSSKQHRLPSNSRGAVPNPGEFRNRLGVKWGAVHIKALFASMKPDQKLREFRGDCSRWMCPTMRFLIIDGFNFLEKSRPRFKMQFFKLVLELGVTLQHSCILGIKKRKRSFCDND